MTISVLEIVSRKDKRYREQRESHHIDQFNLVYRGMNKKRWLFANCNEKILLFKMFNPMTIPNWYDLCFKFCKTLCHDYCCEEDLLYSRNISQTGLKFYVIKSVVFYHFILKLMMINVIMINKMIILRLIIIITV